MAIITISREVAAHGDEVATKLAELTGYTFITRKDIENRIIELGFPKNKMPKYDERKPGFFASLAKDRDEYLNYVEYAILEAATKKNVIIIGRGAFAVMKDIPNNISIRLIADEETRIDRLRKEFDWNEKQALQRIQESDSNRQGFHNSFYNVDVSDPKQFHMILNTGFLGVEKAAEVIAELMKKIITPEDESAGENLVAERLKAQTVVNKLIFEYKVNIEFIHAKIENKTFTLNGVADSIAVVEKALQVVKKELPDYDVVSSVSIVNDFKKTY